MSTERSTLHRTAQELTILMPCLNEIETIATCVAKAASFLRDHGIHGEVLVSDNGSTDGSIEAAVAAGARVVNAPIRGYGGALVAGIESATGKFIIMGDCDDSYDFYNLMPFVEALRSGADLVMGNRFKGGIKEGAMPFLHRYLGNPVLSFLGRLFFRSPIRDFHCGLRGFRKDAILGLNLRTTGMEFASEMVVKASLADLRVDEVPTTLSPDGRSRPPHLRTWRDGWRHLRFLLMYSPRWLFFYPGLACTVVGLFLVLALLRGPIELLPGIVFDVHSIILGCLLILVGTQAISFALLARRYAASRGMLPRRKAWLPEAMSLEAILSIALVLASGGLSGVIYSVSIWSKADFGELAYASLVRMLMISGTSLALSAQLVFNSFISGIIAIGIADPPRRNEPKSGDLTS